MRKARLVLTGACQPTQGRVAITAVPPIANLHRIHRSGESSPNWQCLMTLNKRQRDMELKWTSHV